MIDTQVIDRSDVKGDSRVSTRAFWIISRTWRHRTATDRSIVNLYELYDTLL